MPPTHQRGIGPRRCRGAMVAVGFATVVFGRWATTSGSGGLVGAAEPSRLRSSPRPPIIRRPPPARDRWSRSAQRPMIGLPPSWFQTWRLRAQRRPDPTASPCGSHALATRARCIRSVSRPAFAAPEAARRLGPARTRSPPHCTPVSDSRVGCSRQFGRASAPMMPHWVTHSGRRRSNCFAARDASRETSSAVAKTDSGMVRPKRKTLLAVFVILRHHLTHSGGRRPISFAPQKLTDQQHLRHRESERLGGLEIDDKHGLRGLLYRRIRAADIAACLPVLST
jgi:hypothetical protein